MNIIITGASKGIGKAIAKQFATKGNLLLLCSRNANELKMLQDELTRLGCEVQVKATDMTNKDEVVEFADWCMSWGTPDIIVNNAGQFIPGSVFNEPEGLLEKMLEINLFSAYHLTRRLLPSMMTAHHGHIFNICSIASLQAYPNGGAYGISKFALMGFSKNLREELKPHGIKVTAVSPGATMSASWEGFEIDPLRIMETYDVAKMVFAASQLSAQAVIEDIVLRPQLGDLNSN